jgi:ferritin
MNDMLNDQINFEFFSEYYYLAMSAYCDAHDMPGMSQWMLANSQEEHEHAMRLYNYVISRDGKIELKEVGAPKNDYKSIMDVFETAFNHEKVVTQRIYDLYKLALEEGDYPTQIELQWFIKEQVEEEKKNKDIIQQLKLAGDKHTALFMIDQKLAGLKPDSGDEQ